MASRILFSIYIDIEDDELDNPGYWLRDGTQVQTSKSRETKTALDEWHGDIIRNQSQYALKCDADYVIHTNDQMWRVFKENFNQKYPRISTYDIINFYKHHLMVHHAKMYDEVCYFDLDVVVNTEEDIFEAHDLYNKFACAESNEEADYGKSLLPDEYNLCIRNPASKYWNTYAMLLDEGWSRSEADTDVFNTGIMIASKEMISKLDYFSDLEQILDDMEYLKTDTSLFHPNVTRSFGYDNETIFAYKRVVNNVEIEYIDSAWHKRILDEDVEPAKVYHVISKEFGLFESILRSNR